MEKEKMIDELGKVNEEMKEYQVLLEHMKEALNMLEDDMHRKVMEHQDELVMFHF